MPTQDIDRPSVDLQRDILAIERQRVAAMVDRDLAALDSSPGRRPDLHALWWADRYQGELHRADRRADHGYLGVDYSDEEVRPCGTDGAIVRGVAQIRLIRAGGEKISYPVLFLDVYAVRDGRWQMVAWQATRVPE